MRKRWGLLILFVLLVNSVTVYCGNNGQALTDPFGDCGASPSFGGAAKYYDFLIPYNLTFKDIGGYAKDVKFDPGSAYSGWNMVPSESDLNKRVGQFNRQGSKSSTWIGCTVQVDPNTGFQFVEKDGCQFYIASLPKAPFNYSAVTQEGFYQWASLARTGIIYDMILKDGTVIHFATGDGIGQIHTNNAASDSVSSGGQDGVNIQFADLKYPQYKNLFHASQPNQTFEVFCEKGVDALNKFKNYYGISDSNPVVAIRMWNKSISAGGLTVNPGFNGLSSKGNAIDGTVTAPGGSTVPGGVPGGSAGSNPQYVQGYFDNLDMSVYQALTETNLEEQLLQGAKDSNLGQKDLEGLTDWERNHGANKRENGYIATLRWLVSFVGILMTLWALLVYLAFWFDHINSFFYLDVLHLLTFGALHICPPGEKPTFSLGKKVQTRTVSHYQILSICLTAMLFGALLISGTFYQAVSSLVNFILRWFR